MLRAKKKKNDIILFILLTILFTLKNSFKIPWTLKFPNSQVYFIVSVRASFGFIWKCDTFCNLKSKFKALIFLSVFEKWYYNSEVNSWVIIKREKDLNKILHMLFDIMRNYIVILGGAAGLLSFKNRKVY